MVREEEERHTTNRALQLTTPHSLKLNTGHKSSTVIICLKLLCAFEGRKSLKHRIPFKKL